MNDHTKLVDSLRKATKHKRNLVNIQAKLCDNSTRAADTIETLIKRIMELELSANALSVIASVYYSTPPVDVHIAMERIGVILDMMPKGKE